MVSIFPFHEFNTGVQGWVKAFERQDIKDGLGISGIGIQLIIGKNHDALGLSGVCPFQTIGVYLAPNKMDIRIIHRFFVDIGDNHD